jgi:ribosomal protein S25
MQVNKEQKKRKKAKKEKSTSDDKRKKRRKTRENEAENELPDEDGDVLSKENKVVSVCKVLLITTKAILTRHLEQRSSVSVNQIVASLDDI